MTTSSPDVPRCRRHTLDLSFLLNGDTTMKQLSQKQAALTLKVSKKIYNFKDELKALFDSSQATSSRVNRLVNGILEAIQCETNTAVDDFRGFIFNDILIPVGKQSQDHIAELENDLYRRCESIRQESVADCRRKINDLRDQQEIYAKGEINRHTAELKRSHAIELKDKDKECENRLLHQSKALLPEINQLAETMIKEKDAYIETIQVSHQTKLACYTRRIELHEKKEDKHHAQMYYLRSQMCGSRDMSKSLPEMATQRDLSSQMFESRRRSFLAAKCEEHPSSILDLERILSNKDKEITKLKSTVLDLNEQVNLALELTRDNACGSPGVERMHRTLSRRLSNSSSFISEIDGNNRATTAQMVKRPALVQIKDSSKEPLSKPKIKRRGAVRQHISGEEDLLNQLAAEPMQLPELLKTIGRTSQL